MSTQAAVTITSFDQLLKETTLENKVRFQLEAGGKVFEVAIRPLNSLEVAAANKFVDHVPPRVKGKAGAEDEFDIYDASHREKMEKGARLRRAFVLDKGLVELRAEGDTTEAKAQFLEEKFPPRMLDFLQGKILAISTGDLEVLNLANFTSGEAKEASPAN